MSNIAKLCMLIQSLETSGDPTRLSAARAAYNFKHSWIEMAQTLVEVRSSNRFVSWGYDNFLDYCERELGLKRAVVDKLTTSFCVLQKVAPGRLERVREDEPIPSYQSLDYYARATAEHRLDGNPPRDAPSEELSPELSGQLYDAVFRQNCTAKQLRDRFDPMIRPKNPIQEQHEITKKALNTTLKLLEQLEQMEGINTDTLREAEVALANLEMEIKNRLDDLRPLLEMEKS